jgi:5-methylcytosine-specific restriction endonuclease McrA
MTDRRCGASMHRNMFRGKQCPHCRRVMEQYSKKLQPTWDHVVPRSKGGKKTQVCCQECNAIKSDMMPEEWVEYMALFPGWWLMTKRERRRRTKAWNHARHQRRQGSPPPVPVVVPPELVFGRT